MSDEQYMDAVDHFADTCERLESKLFDKDKQIALLIQSRGIFGEALLDIVRLCRDCQTVEEIQDIAEGALAEERRGLNE